MTAFSPSRRRLLKGAAASSALAVVAGPALARVVAPADPQIERLIAAMSIEEKAGQLSIFGDPIRFDGPSINPTSEQVASRDKLFDDIAHARLTGVYNGIGVEVGREMQKTAMEKAPHKIPLIFGGDVIHGLKTMLPIPLAEAASFDTEVARRSAQVAALEATACGIHWTFAPMVDVARDQRWGRTAETNGEDTWLDCQIATARVEGYQGGDLKNGGNMLACPKHFAAYGAVQGGMEYNTADIPETTLRQVHLPAFKAAFDAGALSTMSSFNDIAGVPSTANHHLLSDILRGEWGFRGLVVSDYTADEELILHGYAADGADAVAKAITAGCDMSMQSGLYNKHLPDLVRSGKVPMAVVDRAVRRVLFVKKALGLFDNPYRSLDLAREKADIRTPQTVAWARETARKSIVMLKNEGGLLPLPKSGKAIALIGPCIDDKRDYPGPWAVFPDIDNCVTIAQGFKDALDPSARLLTARGSDYEAPIDGGIDAAVAAAKQADIVVLVVGESAGMSGEAQSRVEIVVPEPQMALAEAVAATGKPMLVLLRHGRALALHGAVKAAPAILATWFLGSETGHGIADVVFGDHAPQGRLPVSFPQESGQEPYYYNHRNTGRPQLTEDKNYKARYREVTNAALYPFGHGLTYSSVSYSNTTTAAPVMKMGGGLTVSATVTNTGPRAAHEVVQLYVHERVAGITQPVRQLRGVKHLDLAPGQSETVAFTLTAQDLAYVHADLRWSTDAGVFDVWIAPSSVDGAPASFTLEA